MDGRRIRIDTAVRPELERTVTIMLKCIRTMDLNTETTIKSASMLSTEYSISCTHFNETPIEMYILHMYFS